MEKMDDLFIVANPKAVSPFLTKALVTIWDESNITRAKGRHVQMVHHPYLVIPLGQGEDRERELPSPTRARCYMPEFAANNTLEELLEMAAVGKYIKPPPAIIERRE